MVRRSIAARPRPTGAPAGVSRRLAIRVILAIATLIVVVMGRFPAALAAPPGPLSISNVDGPDPVAAGQNLTYTITVVNTGAARLTDVSLTDQVNGVGGIGTPPRLSLTSTRGGCTQSNNLVRCSVGAIEGGDSWVVTITGVVTAASGTTLNNTASVTGTKADRSFTSSDTATTLVQNAGGAPLPDLTLSVAGPSSVPASAPMTYTLTVGNIGAAGAAGVKVVDTLPDGLTAVSAGGTSLFTCDVSGRTVTCTGGAVDQGSNATITIQATSPADTGTLTTTAVVDPDDTIAEGDELNNTAALVNTQVTDEPSPADLSIDVEDSPDPVHPGDLLTYTVTVTNTSDSRARDVAVVEGTQGLDAASVTAEQTVDGGLVGRYGGCTVEASQVTCSIDHIDPDGTMVVTITGTVVAPAGTSIQGSATVTGNIENTNLGNTDTELTAVMPAVDLTITEADLADPVCASAWPGDPAPPDACLGGLAYTLVVGNGGTDPATGVDVRDRLPLGAVFDSFVAPDFAGGCEADADGGAVICTGGTIQPQSTTTITLYLVAPGVIGPISNRATVDPYNAIFEADETNNTTIETTQVLSGVDLVVRVDDLLDPVATAGTLTYVITVDNVGPQDVTGIVVQDVMPAGSVFLSAVGDSGFTCVPAGPLVTCAGGYLPGTAAESYPLFGAPGGVVATIVVRVFAPPVIGVGPQGMFDQVWVDPDQLIPEANELNNVDLEQTDVVVGGAALGAFNQLTITQVQVYPPNPVARNAEVIYDLIIGNDGTDPAVNIDVFEEPPALASFIEARDISGNGFFCEFNQSLDFLDCGGGWIAPGGTATIEVRFFAPDIPGLYTNQAMVDPEYRIPEGNELDNQSDVSTLVVNGGNGPFYDLVIDQIGTPTTTPGGLITYSLRVWNAGSTLSPDVVVRDFLPEGVTVVSARDSAPDTYGAFACLSLAGIVECLGTALPPGIGFSRFITITARAPDAEGTFTNQAVIDPDDLILEGDELNNTAAAVTIVRSNINLRITKTGPTVATQGAVADYEITVENQEPSPGTGQTAFGVHVHDPLPIGLTPLAVDAGPGNNWACQITTNPINVVDCTGDLDPGRPVTITITVQVTADSGRSLDNEACVDPEGAIVEFNPPGETDNCSTHTSPVEPPRRRPDLAITKTVDAATATPGQSQRLTYTITVSNDGDADAVGPITVVDELPGGVIFFGAVAPPGWTCSQFAGVVTCHDLPAPNGGLASGESVQIQIRVNVRPGNTLPISNTVSVRPALADVVNEPDTEHEQDLADNTATVVTPASGPGLDLAIASITDNPDPVERDRQLVHTVVAVNGGDQPATGVHVRIGLPPSGMTVVGASGTNGFTCGTPSAGEIDCVGDLPGGGSTVITVTSLVLLGAPNDLTLTATIDPGGDFTETDEGNNTQSEGTAVTGGACAAPPCVDLVAARLAPSAAEAHVGDPVSFDLEVINSGDSPAQTPDPADPLVFFDLFGDVTLGSFASSSPAVTCATSPDSIAGANLLSNCTGQLGPGEVVTLTITATVNGGAGVTAVGLADPTNAIAETVDFADIPPYGNNRIARTIMVNP